MEESDTPSQVTQNARQQEPVRVKRWFGLFPVKWTRSKTEPTSNASQQRADQVVERRELLFSHAEEDDRHEPPHPKAEPRSSRFSVWKSFFHIFTKSRRNKKSRETIELSEEPCLNMEMRTPQRAAALCGLLQGLDEDNLAMVVTLPPHIRGPDIKVSIELKAIATDNEEMCECGYGLQLNKRSETYAIYAGLLKMPPRTTILEVSRMPLYLISGNANSEEKQIETIIKPLDNILPENCDRHMVVHKINLQLHLHAVRDTNLFNTPELHYIFLSNSLMKSSLDAIRTEDLIENINNAADMPYDESCKVVVNEILSQIVSRISVSSSSALLEEFHREVEEQKSLLLESFIGGSSIHPSLARRSTSSKVSKDTQGTRSVGTESWRMSSTSTNTEYPRTTSISVLERDSQATMLAPANTPEIFRPRCIVLQAHESTNACHFISDERQNYITTVLQSQPSKREWTIKDEVRADIDRTLELLETAKRKLLSHLNQAAISESCDSMVSAIPQVVHRVHVDPFRTVEPPPFFREEEKHALVEKTTTSNTSENCGGACGSGGEQKSSSIGLIKNMLEENIFTYDRQVIDKPKLAEDECETAVLSNEKNAPTEEKEKVRKMRRPKFTYAQLEMQKMHRIETVNDKIFAERYAPGRKGLIADLSAETVEADLDIMMRELVNESNSLRDDICESLYKDPNFRFPGAEIVEDCKYVLDCILDQVANNADDNGDNAVASMVTPPLMHHVNPVYYCLVDDKTHGVARALSWVVGTIKNRVQTHPLKKKNDTRSTVSVRRVSNYAHRHAMRYGLPRGDPLLGNLEGGSMTVNEICMELCSNPFGWPEEDEPLVAKSACHTDADNQQPLLRKSKHLIELERKSNKEKRNSEQVEKLQRVINPDEKEKPARKKNVNEYNWEAACSYEGINWRKIVSIICDDARRTKMQVVNADYKLCNTKIMQPLDNDRKDTKEKNQGEADKKVDEQQSPDNKINAKFGTGFFGRYCRGGSNAGSSSTQEEEPLKPTSTPPEPEPPTPPPPSPLLPLLPPKITFQLEAKQSNHHQEHSVDLDRNEDAGKSVQVLHDESSAVDFESTEQLPTFTVDFNVLDAVDAGSGGRVRAPVADVPRSYGYSSSGGEIAYLRNVHVLEEKLDPDRMATSLVDSKSMSSSSEDSVMRTMAMASTTAVRLSHIPPESALEVLESGNNLSPSISDVNRIECSTGHSTLSSRTCHSTPVTVDYDADHETHDIVLPRLKMEYISIPELNAPEEIVRIQENVDANDRLNPRTHSQDEVHRRDKQPIAQQPLGAMSMESFTTSQSLDSVVPSEIELNLN